MKFSKWMKIREQSAPAPATATATAQTPASGVSSSGVRSTDIATVPQRMFSNERQTSDGRKNCTNCSKDFWKNWHHTRKKGKR